MKVKMQAKEVDVLERPYTALEMERNKDQFGYVSGVVLMSLNDISQYNYEAVLDTLSNRLTGSDLLMNISYEVVGYLPKNDLLVLVSGDVSEILAMEVEDE